MSALRAVITSMLAFTLLGIVLGTLLAPKVLSAELCGFTDDASTSRPCIQTVRDATSGLLRYQGYSAAGGAVVGMIVGIAFAASGRKKKQAAAQTATKTAEKPPEKPAA